MAKRQLGPALEEVRPARPVRIGSLRNNDQRPVIDEETGIEIGEVISNAGPSTLGAAELTHIERDGDGMACGGTVRTEINGLALVGAWNLYKIFRRKPSPDD